MKRQKGNLYKTRKTVCMIGIPEETHKEKTQINNGCNITVKDVERLRQILTPTIHTLPNLEPVMQPYMLLSPFRDKASVARGEEHDIPLQDGVMQPLTPQTTHITPPDDVVLATNPILDKHSNEFGEKFSNITRVAEMADVSQSSYKTGKTKAGMKSHMRYGSNLSLPYPVLVARNWNLRSPRLVVMWYVLWKPSRDFTNPLGPPSGLKGLGYEIAKGARIKSSSLEIIT
ncbi:hypothetical protein Tco_0677648 [Tanacetum coccineum]|uniref:Uncharacterized protein n=1 Tax=Tanacetum coccineum TaxID=301880 RepID=A0ABQ4XCT5_9ASTR